MISHKLKIGVGFKTLLGLSVTFWVPFLVLAITLYFFFQAPLQHALNQRVHSELLASIQIMQERPMRAQAALIQLASQQEVIDAMIQQDTTSFQRLFNQYSHRYSFTTLLLSVNTSRTVIARRNNRSGDQIEIGEMLARTLLLGEPQQNIELLSRDFLSKENEEFKSFFWDLALVQVFTTPVLSKGKVIGALVGGIILSDDPWVSNAIHNRIGVEMAIFAGNPAESSILHSTSSLPRNIWKIRQSLPSEASKSLELGRTYTGLVNIEDKQVTTSYELLKDSRQRIIGVIGVSSSDTNVSSIIQNNIFHSMLIAASIGLFIALLGGCPIMTNLLRKSGYWPDSHPIIVK
ncbi:MAG: cache domain-containing protein [Mariprofundaceae bacterium]|nr:cache domain-containing protein [Mariprofundaceae bacterium]